jgi:chorismate--pyruvate lyase
MMSWSNRNPVHGALRCWLQAGGSLSARLAASGTVFSVQVLCQGRQPLTVDESSALGLAANCPGYAREVVLRVDGVPVVYARSVTAHVHSLGAWRAVRGLGTRPLADVLFRRSGIARQAMAYCKLAAGTTLRRHTAKAWHQAGNGGLSQAAPAARRSVFVRRGAPLLVMEVFAADVAHWRWPGDVPAVTSKRRR